MPRRTQRQTLNERDRHIIALGLALVISQADGQNVIQDAANAAQKLALIVEVMSALPVVERATQQGIPIDAIDWQSWVKSEPTKDGDLPS